MKKIVVTACALLLLSGCGVLRDEGEGGGAASSQQISADDIKPAPTPDPQAIDKVKSLFNLSQTAREAQAVAEMQCMKDRGFKVNVPPMPTARGLLMPYAPLALDQARAHGYERTSSGQDGNELEPIEDVSQKSVEDKEREQREQEASLGDPNSGVISGPGGGSVNQNGCIAKSYESVFGSVEAGTVFLGGSVNLTLPYTNTAKMNLDDLVDRWAECMKDEHHLIVRSPDSVTIDVPHADKDVAIADAQCRVKVDFDATVRNTTNAYLTTFLKDKQEILDKVATAKKAAEENAPKILGR